MDKRFISEKILDRMAAYWTGFCIGWSVFGEPEFWYMFSIFILVLFAIGLLDIALYAIQIRHT
jgi:hypothetical protein